MSWDVLKDFPLTPGAAGSGDAFLVAIYAIISMFVLVGIVHLFSRILRNQKMGDWAKDEFVQALISAAIVGGLYILMAPQTGTIILAFNSLVPTDSVQVPVWYSIAGASGSPFAGGSGIVYENIDASASMCVTDIKNTPLCYAYHYFALLQKSAAQFSMDLITFASLMGILASLSVNLMVVDFAPLSGFTSLVTICNSITQSLLFLGVIAGVEMALLVFIGATALKVFLPIGVVLRCFFATRKIGGLLMAVAVGLYIVFPLTVALNAIALNQVQDSQLLNDADSFRALQNEINKMNPFASDDMDPSDKLAGFITTVALGMSPILTLIRSIPTLSTTMLSAMIVQLIFLPVFSIMITAIAIKELAGLFGSEVNLSRFEV